MYTVNESFLVFKKSLHLSFFVKFELYSKTNKDKSTEIFPPLLLKPTDTCERAMQRANKGSAKGSNLKKTPWLCPSRKYNYSIRPSLVAIIA